MPCCLVLKAEQDLPPFSLNSREYPATLYCVNLKRMLCSDALSFVWFRSMNALVRVLNPLITTTERIHAQVVDWSDEFVTLRLKQPMLVATMVQVRFQGRIALGEVRQCAPANEEFEIRIHFQDVLTVGDTG